MAPNVLWHDRLRPRPVRLIAWALDRREAQASRPWKVKVQLPEEKFTDVAIAVHLVNDFHLAQCSRAILITNDGDLTPAIEMVVQAGHYVTVISPDKNVNRTLRAAASEARPLRTEILGDCQMPDIVRTGGSQVERPNAWKTRK